MGRRSRPGADRRSARSTRRSPPGAGDAEAYVEDSTGREIRVFDGEVESLTEAGERGLGVRCLDRRPGRLRLRHRPRRRRAWRRSPPAPSRRRGSPTPTSSRRRPSRPATPTPGSTASPTPSSPSGRPSARSSSRRRSSARPARPTSAWSRSRPPSTSTRSSGWRSRPRAGLAGEYEATIAYAYLQAIAARGRRPPDRARLRDGPLAGGARPARRSAARRAERATSLLGATKPASRSCPVVLDQTVAASFVGFIGGDAVRRRGPARALAVRRPPRRGGRARRRSRSPTTATDPAGLNSAPVRRRGDAARRARR